MKTASITGGTLALSLFLFSAQPESATATQSKAVERAAASTEPAAIKAEAARCAEKLDYLLKNGAVAHPKQRPTIITEAEINAYLASGRVTIPEGVKNIHLHSAPGVVTSDLLVDFDQLASARHSSNLLLSLFSGTHAVQVVSHAHAAAGVAHTHIDSVLMDQKEVPRFLLQLYVDKFLKPRYPQASLDPEFKLPSRIQTATVGLEKITFTQK
jgi:hypothetical protein